MMQLQVLSKSEHELEIEVHGENETLLNPLKQALLADKDVDFAEYIIEHPSLSVPKIFVRTKGKVKPDVVLKRTIKSLIADFDAFEDGFAAELKKRN
jgi:DNA-directed RNA polymerase subunit L